MGAKELGFGVERFHQKEMSMEQNVTLKMGHDDASVMERVVTAGDLSKVSPDDRVKYYFIVCKSVGLNPYTKPFDLIEMNKKLVLYATKTATDQLRKANNVSISGLTRVIDGDIYTVIAKASMPDGRTDESTGVVAVGNLLGDALANACMKAETKAKRRVTLSIVGLGWMDESEVDSIPGAQRHTIDLPKEDLSPIELEKQGLVTKLGPLLRQRHIDSQIWTKFCEKSFGSVKKLIEMNLDELITVEIWLAALSNASKETTS